MDDGTGTVPCCYWRQANTTDEDRLLYEHGQLVTIQGKISTFREQRQVTVSLIRILTLSFSFQIIINYRIREMTMEHL